MMASVIIGFAVGEPLLALADSLVAPLDGGRGLGKSILVGLSYGLAGIILLLMRTRERPPQRHRDFPHWWQDLRDALQYVNQQPLVKGALIQMVLLFSVFAALAVLAVRLAEIIPALKSSQFGFLLAAGGVGIAVGAAFTGHFGQHLQRRQLGLLGTLGMAGTLAILSMTFSDLWMSLLLIALLGGFAALVGIPMQTTIQEQTPEAMRGKIFGLQNNLVNVALSLPLALAGLAEARLGLRIVFLGLGAIIAVGGLLTWYIAFTASLSPGDPAPAGE
jgi:predicted MFS family arabinose efflux permease